MYICIYYIHKSASTFGTSKTSTHRCEWRQGLAKWMLAATTCIGKMERIFGCSSVSVCEYALVSVWKILNVFCTLILFFCRLDQISSLQKDLTQPKRWSIFSKRSNELVICAKILVSEVSGNSLWSHLSLQLHISLHLPVHLTAHPPKAGDAYQNLVIKFDEPGTKLLHKMIFLATSQHGLVVTSRVPVIEDHPSNLMAIISSVGLHIMTSSCDMESLFLYHFQATLF